MADQEVWGHLPMVGLCQLDAFMRQWQIYVRVVVRSDIREFKNSRGDGKLFSVELIDSQGDQCRATFFGAAVDKFYELLSPGGVFRMSGGVVKQGNPRFCQHRIEITFDERGTMIQALPDDGQVPQLRYNFVPLAHMPEVAPGTLVDVSAVVAELSEETAVTTSRGDSRARRSMTLFDGSGKSCKCTLWGSHVSRHERLVVGDVLFFYHAKVSDFGGGRSIDSTDCGAIDANPDDPRAFALLRWFWDQGGRQAVQPTLSGGDACACSFLSSVANDCVWLSNPAAGGRAIVDRFVAPVTVTGIPHDRPILYMACTDEVPRSDGRSTRKCNRKVLPMGDAWTCNANHICTNPRAKFILRVEVADPSWGKMYVTAFDDEAQILLSCRAQDMFELEQRRDRGDVEAAGMIESIFNAATCKRWAMQLKTRQEDRGAGISAKAVIGLCTPLNLNMLGTQMLKDISAACFSCGAPGGA